jgi:hypothetical protein
VLKQQDVVLFPQPADSEGDEAAGQTAAEGKKSKPMYLRTVLAKQVSCRSSCQAEAAACLAFGWTAQIKSPQAHWWRVAAANHCPAGSRRV